MKIAIVGAGFVGLTAGLRLAKRGHEVVIFEKESLPGGLAIGYHKDKWEWTPEKHYHHWFTNDDFILNLAKEINYPVEIITPKTSAFVNDKIYQLDSPLALLKFDQLSLLERIRTGIVIAFLRFNPYWQPLEKINADKFLKLTMGDRAYSLLWETQLKNKMGKYAQDVSLVWFWSRIKKRTKSLAYPRKGFLPFAQAVVKEFEKYNGKIIFNAETISITQKASVEIVVSINNKKKSYNVDKTIVTLPSFAFLKITPQLSQNYKNSFAKLKGLGATNLVLRLRKKFLPDNTYWLSICEPDAPIMAIVEHTNFISSAHYNNEHIVYLGNYPETDSSKFQLEKEELLKFYDPFLKRINANYEQDIIGTDLFKAPFAQPIVPKNYSKIIPKMVTPLKDIYLANIEQVYPWDRGTNYAVELGEKVAKLCTTESNQS